MRSTPEDILPNTVFSTKIEPLSNSGTVLFQRNISFPSLLPSLSSKGKTEAVKGRGGAAPVTASTAF